MRTLLWLVTATIIAVLAAFIATGDPSPGRAQAQAGEAGMSLHVRRACNDASDLESVQANDPFVVCVVADPAPGTQVSGFGTQVLFDDGLEWRQRPRCQDEVQVGREDPGEQLAACLSFTPTLLGGAGHAVLSAAEFPVPALDIEPGSTQTLVEMDFVCTLGGEYTLTLTAESETPFGAVFGDLSGSTANLRTVSYDYDGDTVANQVADFVTLRCAGPTATPCPSSGCPTATITPTFTAILVDTPENLTATAEAIETMQATDDGGTTNEGDVGSGGDDDGGGPSIWLWVGLGAAVVVLAGGAGYDFWRRYQRRRQI